MGTCTTVCCAAASYVHISLSSHFLNPSITWVYAVAFIAGLHTWHAATVSNALVGCRATSCPTHLPPMRHCLRTRFEGAERECQRRPTRCAALLCGKAHPGLMVMTPVAGLHCWHTLSYTSHATQWLPCACNGAQRGLPGVGPSVSARGCRGRPFTVSPRGTHYARTGISLVRYFPSWHS